MEKITATDIIAQIAQLDRAKIYPYVGGQSKLRITEVIEPEGPIRFTRIKNDGTLGNPGGISKQMIALMASLCSTKPNYPLHVDRVFSAGGNSRSALETLLAHTPHFFVCYPKRIDVYSGEIIENLKHIMWCPDDAHEWSVIARKPYDEIISEVEMGLDFGQIKITSADLGDEFDSIQARTTHIQMQIALIEIGRALNFRTWIAKNDRSIQVQGKSLGQFEGVVQSLDEMNIFYSARIKDAAALIDCIWFTEDGNQIPAIIEIEHSTGVTSGLTRMLKLREVMPAIQTTFTVVAPNLLRNKVVSEANQRVFSRLQARYMPYSTVRELYSLIHRYALSGVVDHKFIDPFMEKVVIT